MDTVTVPKKEYEELARKAKLFDEFVETENLSEEELKRIKEALSGPFQSKEEFLKRHPELA